MEADRRGGGREAAAGQGRCQEEQPVHVMSDDVGRHNIKIYEAFNKFSFAQSRTEDRGPSTDRVGSRMLSGICVGVSTEKCCLVNSFEDIARLSGA